MFKGIKNKFSAVKLIMAWCLYDWACAAFSVIVLTFIFATYFTTKIAANPIIGTYQWANATSLAGLCIAGLSPLMGSIADHGGQHKRWLTFFTILCVISSACLWFAYPAITSVRLTLICMVCGLVSIEIALVFYNSFLPMLAPKDYLGRISGWGWGCGYLGGITALTIALLFFIKFNVFSLDAQTAAPVRICGPLVAVWYLLFSIPFIILAPTVPSANLPPLQAVRAGWWGLIATLKKLPQEKDIFLYLIAHMIYNDGLTTLFIFGGIYAAGTFGMSFQEVLLFGITMNISAGIGAILLAWMDDFLGSKATVIVSLICLICLGLPLVFLKQKLIFWIFALCLCVFVGPVQSASRSIMVRLMAGKPSSAEMFGLYALSGRLTAFIGPWLFGFVTLTFGTQRAGIATILIFLALGAILLLPVRVMQ